MRSFVRRLFSLSGGGDSRLGRDLGKKLAALRSALGDGDDVVYRTLDLRCGQPAAVFME